MKARIIIPVWGEKYLKRMDSACLPALLAPGNLPHLAQHFECDLVIVTESKLFDAVRALPSIVRAQKLAGLRLTAIDDVMSHPAYYGLTITHALYRGFTDLGDAAKDVWCVFLNADFILADGSYRVMVEKMLAGETCIFAPSYCAIEEEVLPVLKQGVTAVGDLPMPKRTMAGLILDHAHFTIRSKIINCQMYQIDRVDQFYYLHDNDTLIGRQLPIAIVAFRPERVPLEPVTFWDYGVVSEICPTAKLCVLGDSDDFLMLELRGGTSMSEQLRLGKMDPEEIAADLSRWTTKDQRDCGEFTLILHRRDLSDDSQVGVAELDRYYRDVFRRVAAVPRSHRDHYIWTGVVELHREWQARRDRTPTIGEPEQDDKISIPSSSNSLALVLGILIEILKAPIHRDLGAVARRFFDLLRHIYLRLFGRLPDIGPLHPMYSDVAPVVADVRAWAMSNRTAGRALVLQGAVAGAIGPLLMRWIPGVARATPADFLENSLPVGLPNVAPFDLCIVECNRAEFARFRNVYLKLRPLMSPGGKILLQYRTRGIDRIFERDFELIAEGMPRQDIASLELQGSWPAKMAQRLWDAAGRIAVRGRITGMLALPFLGGLVGLLSLLGNWRSKRTRCHGYNPHTTSMLLTVTVR